MVAIATVVVGAAVTVAGGRVRGAVAMAAGVEVEASGGLATGLLCREGKYIAAIAITTTAAIAPIPSSGLVANWAGIRRSPLEPERWRANRRLV